jgi:hypothetical protein
VRDPSLRTLVIGLNLYMASQNCYLSNVKFPLLSRRVDQNQRFTLATAAASRPKQWNGVIPAARITRVHGTQVVEHDDARVGLGGPGTGAEDVEQLVDIVESVPLQQWPKHEDVEEVLREQPLRGKNPVSVIGLSLFADTGTIEPLLSDLVRFQVLDVVYFAPLVLPDQVMSTCITCTIDWLK